MLQHNASGCGNEPTGFRRDKPVSNATWVASTGARSDGADAEGRDGDDSRHDESAWQGERSLTLEGTGGPEN